MVQSILQLDALGEQWAALAAPFGSPLLDHDWFLSCAEAFHGDHELRVLTVWNEGILTGVAPLVQDGRNLVLLGSSRLFEPSGWLHATDEALRQLVAEAIHLGDPIVLQRLPAESRLARVFEQLPKRSAWTVVRRSADSLSVRIQGGWEGYYARLSSRITSNLPRLRRKAEKLLGPMRFSQITPAPAEVAACLETVTAIEDSGWKGRRGSSMAARADLRSFFLRYCGRAASKGRLRVSTLAFGAHLAAVELGVEAYGRMWQLKIGYQEALARYYPGLHLTECSIRSAFERGLDSYEFLGSSAPWEEQWRPEARQYRLVAVYPVTTNGVLGACRDAAGTLRRRLTRAGRVTTA
jgi:CelD/BcsL family acetyltransferase involved in cellulose biosynthesis